MLTCKNKVIKIIFYTLESDGESRGRINSCQLYLGGKKQFEF